ncbi:MAG: zinc ribbon domain-containing protein [Bacilli bacterium]|nr:zinc ribbon domain-containing protein [Bacilli bacterium]
MKCKKCGTLVQEEVITCPNCGENLNDQVINSVINSENRFQIKTFALAAFFVMILTLVTYSLFFTMNITVIGTWKCADYETDIDISKDLNTYFEIEFRKDNSFRYDTNDSAKSDLHMVGSYSVEDKSKANDSRYLGIQQVYYVPSTIVRNGEKSVSKNTSNYEFDFLDKNIVLMIDTQNSSSYICKK